ncbi:hypothetical protein EON64_11200, partial [archaeon]
LPADQGPMLVDAQHCVYDLFAVCNHYGQMGFGHYTAMCRDRYSPNLLNNAVNMPLDPAQLPIPPPSGLHSQWWHFDDENVARIGPGDVRTSHAYILFYQRRSKPQEGTKKGTWPGL